MQDNTYLQTCCEKDPSIQYHTKNKERHAVLHYMHMLYFLCFAPEQFLWDRRKRPPFVTRGHKWGVKYLMPFPHNHHHRLSLPLSRPRRRRSCLFPLQGRERGRRRTTATTSGVRRAQLTQLFLPSLCLKGFRSEELGLHDLTFF